MNKKLNVALMLGFLISFLTGVLINELNRIFVPEYVGYWRVVAWTLGMGLLFSWGFYDLLNKVAVNSN